MIVDKKREILFAATIIFGKFGFHGATMEEIAKEAGIGKGTIYGYFSSKEILFYEMIIYVLKEYERGMEETLNTNKTLEERLGDFAEFHKEQLNKYLDISQIFVWEKEVLSMNLMEEIKKEKSRLFNYMKNIIKEEKNKGELRKNLDEELAAIVIIGSINQFYGQKLCYERIPFQEVYGDKLIETLMRGLV